jgi:hypothetical protein
MQYLFCHNRTCPPRSHLTDIRLVFRLPHRPHVGWGFQIASVIVQTPIKDKLGVSWNLSSTASGQTALERAGDADATFTI